MAILYIDSGSLGNTTISGSITITSTTIVTGSFNAASLTGSLFGTASWATTAVTASYITSSNVFGPNSGNTILTSSYTVTSSYSPVVDFTTTPRRTSLNIYASLGSVVKAETYDSSIANITLPSAMVNNTAHFIPLYLDTTSTITGVKWFQSIAGNYNNQQYNGVAIYSAPSAGNITLISSSTDNGNIWKATSNTWTSQSFSSAATLSAGTYFIATFYNASSITSNPSILGISSLAVVQLAPFDFTNSNKISSTITGATANSPQTSYAMSTLSNNALQRYFTLF